MDSPSFIYRYKLHHLLFWLVMFGGWYYFRYQNYPTTDKALLITFIKVFDLALMVYITNYVLIPKLLYKKQQFLFGVIFLAMICISSIVKMNIIGNMLNAPEVYSLFGRFAKNRIYDNIIPHFLLVSTGAAFKLLMDYAKAQKRLGEMAKEKAEAELNFLKSQINPHFLFNSLNSVYFLIDKQNAEARNALHKFSDMLRYQLYELKGEKIPIEKEIGYIKDYVDLQKLRQNDNCTVELSIDENVKGFYIEPLLLIPFVENSFKHISHFSNGKKNEIAIELTRQKGEMNFIVKNTTEGKQVQEVQPAGGIGLNNVKRRLELLYAENHQLNIQQKEDWFDVSLKLKINN